LCVASIRGRAGEYAQSAKITLAQFGQQYLDYARANKRSWLRDEQIMTHLNTAMGAAQLGDIGALQIERYKLDRLKQSPVRRRLIEKWRC